MTLLGAATVPARAAVFTVTTTADSGPGSLRNCIRQANKAPDKDRILFNLPDAEAVDGLWTIRLLTELPDLTSRMRIVGPGSGKLVIKPDTDHAFGIFDFHDPDLEIPNPDPTFELYLANLTLADSTTALNLFWSKATVERCVLTGNNGSAVVLAAGNITANNCQFNENETTQGGAIRTVALGTMTLADCEFYKNTAQVGGSDSQNRGGALYVMGKLTATRCRFLNNTSKEGGAVYAESTAEGAESNNSAVSLDECMFANNSTIPAQSGGNGGAISVGATDLNIQRSDFENNTASLGGAIYTNSGGRIGRSMIWINSSTYGAAIAQGDGDLTVANCTLAYNAAGGGGAGILLGSPGVPGTPNCILVNCTLLHNGSNAVGEVLVNAGTLSLINTILRPLENGHSLYKGTNGHITSLGHNLAADDGRGFLVASGDLINARPLLDNKPKDNGGPTRTIALLSGSPAIGAGDDSVLGGSYGLSTDQRGAGFPRRSGNHVDIGAFEVQKPAPAPAKPSSENF